MDGRIYIPGLMYGPIRASVKNRAFLKVENIRLVCLLDLTADFGVKANAKYAPNCNL